MSYSDTDTKMEWAGDNFARNPSFYSIFMLKAFRIWFPYAGQPMARRFAHLLVKTIRESGGRALGRGRRQVGTPLQAAAIWHHHRGSQVAREAVGAMHINRY
ncbi:hypothetical protein VaNZ11_011146 [Volvox africanus]|uniref:Uncharacterized protein n=1 Tax=Volvox africanus TaxID=51714 RepID=A0ABQ5SD30_9CHLO|nr:hypothetical protein VaNZ11_011146 [Volvox africanus]